LQTVAEWVENERDVELLREWGIDYMQGFLFGAAQMELPTLLESMGSPDGDTARNASST